jgi:hypothetical protein
MNETIALRESFAAKSPERIRDEFRGFPAACIDAALRYRAGGHLDDFFALLPGMIAFHLPRGATPPPPVLAGTLRLKEDLGLDSLALTEMAFKLEDLFGFEVASGDVAAVRTVADLQAFLKARLEAR